DTSAATSPSSDPPPNVPPIGDSLFLTNTCPTADKSWIEFEAMLSEERNYGTVFETTLGQEDINLVPFDPTSVTELPNELDQSDIETVIANASTELRFRWTGFARRHCHKITRPRILTIGDVTLHPIGREKFIQTEERTPFGTSIYYAKWDMRFRVKEAATSTDNALDEKPDDPDAGSEESP
ncbi:MAG: hypothetical protein AAF664_26480, partial [Planctomycetota bacterium]